MTTAKTAAVTIIIILFRFDNGFLVLVAATLLLPLRRFPPSDVFSDLSAFTRAGFSVFLSAAARTLTVAAVSLRAADLSATSRLAGAGALLTGCSERIGLVSAADVCFAADTGVRAGVGLTDCAAGLFAAGVTAVRGAAACLVGVAVRAGGAVRDVAEAVGFVCASRAVTVLAAGATAGFVVAVLREAGFAAGAVGFTGVLFLLLSGKMKNPLL